MEQRETRKQSRDSLFLVARLRLERDGENHEVKLRNISNAGVMAEGAARAQRGQSVWVDLRNIGWVEGFVAWAAGDRCGIAFCDQIASEKVRFPVKDLDLPIEEHQPAAER